MFKNTDFDSFVQGVLNGDSFSKTASVAEPLSTNPSIADAVNKAYSHLSQEEIAMADSLGFMEATNTVKQANYLKQTLEGENNMYYNQNPYMGKYASATMADYDTFVNKPTLANYQRGKADGAGISNVNPISGKQYRELKQHATVNVEKGVINNIKQHLLDKGVQLGKVPLEDGKRALMFAGAKSYAPHAAGAVVGLAGAGYGAHKLNQRRIGMNIEKARLEQSIGRKVLSHLGKHSGKYALGAGALGLAGLAMGKSASEDLLIQQAAIIGEQFIEKLASNSYENAIIDQLALFRESALVDLQQQEQAAYLQGYGY